MLATMLQGFGVFFTTNRGLIGWLIIGLLAAWLAGTLSRGRGYGCIVNVILGLIGAVLAGAIFTRLGGCGAGFIYSLAAATVGSVLMCCLSRRTCGSQR